MRFLVQIDLIRFPGEGCVGRLSWEERGMVGWEWLCAFGPFLAPALRHYGWYMLCNVKCCFGMQAMNAERTYWYDGRGRETTGSRYVIGWW